MTMASNAGICPPFTSFVKPGPIGSYRTETPRTGRCCGQRQASALLHIGGRLRLVQDDTHEGDGDVSGQGARATGCLAQRGASGVLLPGLACHRQIEAFAVLVVPQAQAGAARMGIGIRSRSLPASAPPPSSTVAIALLGRRRLLPATFEPVSRVWLRWRLSWPSKLPPFSATISAALEVTRAMQPL